MLSTQHRLIASLAPFILGSGCGFSTPIPTSISVWISRRQQEVKFHSGADSPLEVVSGPYYWWTEPVWMDKPALRIEGVSIGWSVTTHFLPINSLHPRERESDWQGNTREHLEDTLTSSSSRLPSRLFSSRSVGFLCEFNGGSPLRWRCFTLSESPSAENWQTAAPAFMRLLLSEWGYWLLISTSDWGKEDWSTVIYYRLVQTQTHV